MTLEEKILAIVQLVRLQPVALLAAIRGGYEDIEVKRTCLDLIMRGKLFLSSDRYWEIPTEFEEDSE